MKKSLFSAIELLVMTIVLAIGASSTAIVYATSNADDNPGNGDTQPDRVGSHDDEQQTSGEGADAGGTVTDPTITGDDETVEEEDTVNADCFGKVIEHEAQEHKEDPDEGTLGEHSSDPVPGDDDNETPRQGIGNQDQGTPAAHGAFNAQFEEEDAENVEENC
jgi:hypothetical protein